MPPNERVDPLWSRYERSVYDLLASLDPATEVFWDHRVTGRLSLAKRQVDVWARGTVIGQEITVVVECKRHRRKVQVGTVDELIGKILDVGADRGVLYSYSGFTDAAVTRAASASNPHVMAVAVETPASVVELQGIPGYPVDLEVQEMAPQWIEELDSEAFARFLTAGEWSKFWS